MTELDAGNQGYRKVARVIDQALGDLARYLNGIPYTVTIDGLATRRLWGGLHNNKQGQPGKPGTTWLPGHTLPLAQQPMAIIRLNKDTDEIPRPIRVTRLSPHDEVINSTETTELMYRVETDFGNPVWLLVTVPPQYDGASAGRLGDKKTRWTADHGSSTEGDLRRNEMRATWYAMNATEIYVIPIAQTVDSRALAQDHRQALPSAPRLDRPYPLPSAPARRRTNGPRPPPIPALRTRRRPGSRLNRRTSDTGHPQGRRIRIHSAFPRNCIPASRSAEIQRRTTKNLRDICRVQTSPKLRPVR